jgi:hypothetical protein
MAKSRSPVTFFRRSGIDTNEQIRPTPRLYPADLLVNFIPTDKNSVESLAQVEGTPPPDRGTMRPWSNYTVE